MAISGIGNNGFAVQQQYSVPRFAGQDSSAAGSAQTQVGAAKQAAGPDQSRQDEAEQQRIQQEVQQLKAIEVKVKAHEAAHKAAGGQYASSASYSYRPGPDGRSYIVAGEVQIDMSAGQTPQETIAKMQIVQRAALAPADPSGQDRAVAAAAAAQIAKAQQQKLQQANDEQAQTTAASGSSGSVGRGPSLTANGSSSFPGIGGGETGTNRSAGGDGSSVEDAAAVVTKGQRETEGRQIGAYKANTTPGDIFGAQKISAYA